MNLDQIRIIGALAAMPEPGCMTADDLFDALEALPGYSEFIIDCQSWTGTGDLRTDRFKLMARDIPHRGRRFTNLTTGFEWMDIRDIAKHGEWTAVAIYHPTTEAILGSALMD